MLLFPILIAGGVPLAMLSAATSAALAPHYNRLLSQNSRNLGLYGTRAETR